MKATRALAMAFVAALIWGNVQRAGAVPVLGRQFQLAQPDGTLVDVRIWGDEFYQVVESLDGYTLVRDPKTGEICYASLASGGAELASTGGRVDGASPGALGLKPHLRINAEARKTAVAAARARFAEGERKTLMALGAAPPQWGPPSSGDVKGICLIVDFPDERGTIPPSEVNDYCNKIGYTGYGNAGSIYDYFFDVSDGKLRYNNYVPSVYYTAHNNKGYYDNPNEQSGPKARELIIEALTWLDGQGFDFSKYDSNRDGLIDAINCYYAGTTSSGWIMGLWPHSWTVDFSADGVRSYKYQITDMGSQLTISTFCHENGHMVCWYPDLYDYQYDSYGAGLYCLMAYGGDGGGGRNPVEICGFLKDLSGWTNTTLLTVPQIDLPTTAGVNTVYKFAHPTLSNEYFIVENRFRTGRDVYLPDSGIAIWHCDTSMDGNDYQQMLPNLHFEATLVQADGRWDLERDRNWGDSTDLWKAPTFTQLGPATNPNSHWWDGSDSFLNIYGVSTAAPTMTFSFGEALIEGIDLVVAGVSHTPSPAEPGADVTFTVAVRNRGATDVTTAIVVGFYADRATAPAITDIPDNEQTIPSLGRGQTAVVEFKASNQAEGTYLAWAYVDLGQGAEGGDIAEVDETNNVGPPSGHPWLVMSVNDNFADANLIFGTVGQVTASNANASKEPGEPNHAGNAGGKSLWWSWTAPYSRKVTFDTFGSDFDTLLGIYTGTDVSHLTEVASSDDAIPSLQGKASFNTVAGTTYFIAVDGFQGLSGHIVLNWAMLADRLSNISTRGWVGSGDNVMIAGFIVEGTEPKQVGVTGWGPSLTAQSVPKALANPTIAVLSGQTAIASNDDWVYSYDRDKIMALGLDPPSALESAVVVTLDPGEYTAILSGVNGGVGNGLIAVWDTGTGQSVLKNISSRGRVGTVDDVMIAGFIIEGVQARKVAVTGWGPILSGMGVPNALGNPMLRVYSGQTLLALNDDWIDSPYTDDVIKAGLTPASMAESAIVLILQPGPYTAILSGADGGTGVGLVAVWDIN